jgi:DNA-binding transcriptional ArsR family regulator
MGKARRQPNRVRAGTAPPAARRTAAAPAAGRTSPGARWTFLTNHSHVLILLSQDSMLVLREVAARVGITERAVQRIISDLEEAGFLERERLGRRNRYRIRSNQPLRHPIESHHTVGELIALVSSR